MVSRLIVFDGLINIQIKIKCGDATLWHYGLIQNTFSQSWQYYLSSELLNQNNRVNKKCNDCLFRYVCWSMPTFVSNVSFVEFYAWEMYIFALSQSTTYILMTRKGSEMKSYRILSVWMLCMHSECISFLCALISSTINTSIILVSTYMKSSSTSRSLFNRFPNIRRISRRVIPWFQVSHNIKNIV